MGQDADPAFHLPPLIGPVLDTSLGDACVMDDNATLVNTSAFGVAPARQHFIEAVEYLLPRALLVVGVGPFDHSSKQRAWLRAIHAPIPRERSECRAENVEPLVHGHLLPAAGRVVLRALYLSGMQLEVARIGTAWKVGQDGG
jgi:hypothetical protein